MNPDHLTFVLGFCYALATVLLVGFMFHRAWVAAGVSMIVMGGIIGMYRNAPWRNQ